MQSLTRWRKISRYRQIIRLLPQFDSSPCIIQREVPPEAEWWDNQLLPRGSYSDLEKGIEHLNLRGNSVIDHLIQHPIPIPPPGDKNKVAPKPLMLTKKVDPLSRVAETSH